MDFTTVTP